MRRSDPESDRLGERHGLLEAGLRRPAGRLAGLLALPCPPLHERDEHDGAQDGAP